MTFFTMKAARAVPIKSHVNADSISKLAIRYKIALLLGGVRTDVQPFYESEGGGRLWLVDLDSGERSEAIWRRRGETWTLTAVGLPGLDFDLTLRNL